MKTSYKCICCRYNIELLYPDTPPRDEKDPTNAMWNNGVVDELATGYGSIHDGSIFAIAICDSCIFKKLEEGSLVHLKDYM